MKLGTMKPTLSHHQNCFLLLAFAAIKQASVAAASSRNWDGGLWSAQRGAVVGEAIPVRVTSAAIGVMTRLVATDGILDSILCSRAERVTPRAATLALRFTHGKRGL